MIKLLTLLSVAVIATYGCAGQPTKALITDTQVQGYRYTLSDLIKSNYQAADSLVRNSNGKLLNQPPILSTTLLNIDNLEESSSFGRLVAEQISARLSNSSYNMIEMKMQNHVYMKNNVGELMLTRKISEIASTNNAHAIIVGTYFVGKEHISVNLKAVRPLTNEVISAHDYLVPVNEFTAPLIGFKKIDVSHKILVTGNKCDEEKSCAQR